MAHHVHAQRKLFVLSESSNSVAVATEQVRILVMDAAEAAFTIAATNPNRDEERIDSIRAKLDEVRDIVARKGNELEGLVRQSQAPVRERVTVAQVISNHITAY
jgi:hypothetical protein